MKFGPIHSEIRDFIQGGHSHQSEWSPHFANDEGHTIVLRDEPDIRALSRFEVK